MRSRHKSKQNSKRNLARKYGVTHMYIWPRKWRYSCNKEQCDRSAGLAAPWALLFSCQRRWGLKADGAQGGATFLPNRSLPQPGGGRMAGLLTAQD